MDFWYSLIVIVVSYLIGSIPFGYLIGRLKGIDIRKCGSGNIGTTNSWRVLGPFYGILVLIGDVFKGVLAVWLGSLVSGVAGLEVFAGLSAIIGHSWPIFLKFKGGKVVATGAGVVLALSYPTLVTILLVWAIVLLLFRYVSLSSICAAVLLPIYFYLWEGNILYALFGALAAFLVVYKHLPNIKRLLAGNEFKLGSKK